MVLKADDMIISSGGGVGGGKEWPNTTLGRGCSNVG